MLNLSQKRKNKYINQYKQEMHKRLTGQPRASVEEREQLRLKKLRIKDKFEINNMGQFTRIYPLMPQDLEQNESAFALAQKYEVLI